MAGLVRASGSLRVLRKNTLELFQELYKLSFLWLRQAGFGKIDFLERVILRLVCQHCQFRLTLSLSSCVTTFSFLQNLGIRQKHASPLDALSVPILVFVGGRFQVRGYDGRDVPLLGIINRTVFTHG
jgi:hypothetical protein